jgi:hypothetical protein
VFLHTDAIAQDRAAAKGRRGIHAEHGHLFAIGPRAPDELIGERGFSRTRRARDADEVSRAGVGIDLRKGEFYAGLTVFYEGDEARERSLISGEKFIG